MHWEPTVQTREWHGKDMVCAHWRWQPQHIQKVSLKSTHIVPFSQGNHMETHTHTQTTQTPPNTPEFGLFLLHFFSLDVDWIIAVQWSLCGFSMRLKSRFCFFLSCHFSVVLTVSFNLFCHIKMLIISSVRGSIQDYFRPVLFWIGSSFPPFGHWEDPHQHLAVKTTLISRWLTLPCSTCHFPCFQSFQCNLLKLDFLLSHSTDRALQRWWWCFWRSSEALFKTPFGLQKISRKISGAFILLRCALNYRELPTLWYV